MLPMPGMAVLNTASGPTAPGVSFSAVVKPGHHSGLRRMSASRSKISSAGRLIMQENLTVAMMRLLILDAPSMCSQSAAKHRLSRLLFGSAQCVEQVMSEREVRRRGARGHAQLV